MGSKNKRDGVFDNRLRGNEKKKDRKKQGADQNDLIFFANTLTPILYSDTFYETLLELIKDNFGIAKGIIFSLHKRSKTYVFRHSLGRVKGLDFPRLEYDRINKLFFDGKPLRIAALKNKNSSFLETKPFSDFQFEILVPLKINDNVAAVLMLGEKPDKKTFSDRDLLFFEQLATHASLNLHNCQIYEKRLSEKKSLDKTLHNLSLLYSINRAMTFISDLKSLLGYILRQAIQIAKAEKGSIMLYDPDTGQLKVHVIEGLADKEYQDKVNSGEILCQAFKPGEGVAGQVFKTGKPIIVNKIDEDARFLKAKKSYAQSIACIPMSVYGEVIGVINMTNKQGRPHFSKEDLEMLKAVADQSAVSINKAQLWEMAVTDSLTGLYIRRFFMSKLHEEIRRAERYGKTFSIVMADLDNFKVTNDTYGHSVGDQVLLTIAKILQMHSRNVDIVGRYGGEEFVLLLPETNKESAFKMGERLRKTIAETKSPGVPSMTISIGIASFPEDSRDMDTLINKADAAMYHAKRLGKNRVEMAENNDSEFPLN